MINKIIIAGANGFLGTNLARYFKDKANEIILLARHADKENSNGRWVIWDGKTPGQWTTYLEDADVLINLAGKNVDCRYTKENKKLIYDSRLNATAVLGEAVMRCSRPPKLWINASSATIYRASYDKIMTETAGEIGDDFSMDVCKKWEAAFNHFKCTSTRQVILRTSIVLGRDSGALPALKNLVRAGIGGPQGNGEQYCSWIHIRDFCRVVEWLISNNGKGIYNITAPRPVTNKDFMKILRKEMNILFGLPLPEWLLDIGAVFLRTETELVLKSRNVFPERLSNEGFVFEFPEIQPALHDLCGPKKTIG